jgi:DNA polymerase
LTVLQIDFETRSTVDLGRAGVYKYAQHPTTDVLCMAYAFDDGEVEIWHGLQTEKPRRRDAKIQGHRNWKTFAALPPHVSRHIKAGGEVRAWNAQFERIIWNEILVKRYGFPPLRLEQTYCTAAEAAAMSLPRHLGQCALVLGLEQQKDDVGYRLMMQMCKPRKPRKDEDPDAILWWDDAERLERLYAYCKDDVRTERAVGKTLRRLPAAERQVYLLDQTINDRGVRVDLDLVSAAQRIVDRGTEIGNRELQLVTSGAVNGVTKIQDLKLWLAEQGLEVDSLSKDIVRDLLKTELSPEVARALTIRAEVAKSSTAKLVSMVEATCDDSRARGLLLYHGAGTGRWSGKLIQPQNFPRPEIKNVERFIPDVLANDYTLIAMEEPPVVVVSSMLRSMLTASPGHVLRAGDFGQIEARVLAWIAEQEDLLALFASGGKVYEEMGAYIFDVALEEVTAFMRQIGKNSILGAGFQMGPDRFAEQVQEQTGIVLDRGEKEIRCLTCGHEERVAGNAPKHECKKDCEVLVTWIRDDLAWKAIHGYREKNYKIKGFWKIAQDAAMRATMEPGSVHAIGRRGLIKFTRRGNFLFLQLPSGRFLAYARPEIRPRKAPWDEEQIVNGLTFMGVNPITRKWVRMHTYGGMIVENIVQATARDLMAAAMLRLESAGYPVCMTIHDEVVCDVPDGFGSQEEFLKLMIERPLWAVDLPVKVDGYAAERYRK